MKKTFTILFLIIFSFSGIFAQKTNDNGSTGGNNTHNNPPKNDNNNTDGNTQDGLLLQLTKAIFGIYQQSLISKRGNDPAVFGLEIGATGGILTGSNSFIEADPRIRYNKGAISFDGRYDYLKGDYTSQNLDALIEFNIIAGKGFKMAIGQGIMYQIESSSMYHESYLGLDLGMNSKQIIISPEFRLGYDWAAYKPVNTEVGLKGAYRILNAGNLSVYLNAGAGYRYLGTNTSYANVFGGLNLLF